MEVSFVIPTYNSEKMILECIESILLQKNETDEIIVVDNGSTDSTLDILKKIGIFNIYIKKNCNISALRNFGAMKSSGNLLAFIDSDCVLKKGWMISVRSFLANENIHVSGCKVDFPVNAKWIEKAWFSQKRSGIFRANYINSGNFIIKRDVFNVVTGFDETLVTGEDSEFCLRITEMGYSIYSNDAIGVIHLDNPINLYEFFKKEYWHSLGMFGSFKVDFFDKPLIATCLYMFSFIISILLLIINVKQYLILSIILVAIIPLLATIYRVSQFKDPHYFFQLFVLFNVYFISRSLALIKIVIMQLVKSIV